MSNLYQVGGLPTSGANIGFMQPKQQNKWQARFIGFGGTGPGASGDLSIQIKKLTRPALTFNEHELHRYNSSAKILGKHKIGELKMSFEDDITNRAGTIIQSQLQRQQFVIGAEGDFLAAGQEGGNYKFGIAVDLLNGNSTVLETWVYEGCAIKEANWSELDYSDSKQIDIDLTMTVDHMYQAFGARVERGIGAGPGAGHGVP